MNDEEIKNAALCSFLYTKGHQRILSGEPSSCFISLTAMGRAREGVGKMLDGSCCYSETAF